MAVITIPSGLQFGVEFSLGQARFDLMEMSESTGNTADRLLGPPRWRAGIQSPAAMQQAEAAKWESLVLKLRGRVNHLALYDPVKLAPRGTMRGTMTLNGAHAAGATSISVTAGVGQAGTTLLEADKLQLGTGVGTSQLVQIVADATANGSGVISLTIEPPLRIAFSGGAAVTWDKPLAYFKLTNEAASWRTRAGMVAASGFALDLLEQWS